MLAEVSECSTPSISKPSVRIVKCDFILTGGMKIKIGYSIGYSIRQVRYIKFMTSILRELIGDKHSSFLEINLPDCQVAITDPEMYLAISNPRPGARTCGQPFITCQNIRLCTKCA